MNTPLDNTSYPANSSYDIITPEEREKEKSLNLESRDESKESRISHFYVLTPDDLDTHQIHKEKFIYVMSQDLISATHFTGEKDYTANLKERIHQLILDSSRKATRNLDFIGQGQFKTMLKINLVTKDKLGISKIKPMVVSALETSKEMALIKKNTLKNELKMMVFTAKNTIPGVLPNYGVLQNENTGDFVLITKFCNKGALKNCGREISNNDPKKK